MKKDDLCTVHQLTRPPVRVCKLVHVYAYFMTLEIGVRDVNEGRYDEDQGSVICFLVVKIT